MDLGWFVTIPGMLITGGVLLLLIALIIFISTSGKKKKNEVSVNSEKEAQNMVDGVFSQVIENGPAEVANSVAPVDSDMPQVAFATPEAIPAEQVEAVQMPEAAQTPEAIAPVMPEVAPTPEVVAPAMPEVAPTPEVVAPVMPEVASTSEVVAPVMPEVVPPIDNSVQTQQPTQSTIYGGANPTVTMNDVVDTTPHQIYGGADPLENTQTIAVTPQVVPAAPVSAEPQITPVVEPINPNNV